MNIMQEIDDASKQQEKAESFDKPLGFLGFRDLFQEVDLQGSECESGSRKRKTNFYLVLESIKCLISAKLTSLKSGSNLFSFLVLFGRYLWIRIRVFLLFVTVFFELISDVFVKVKDWIVSKLFWGRSKAFRYVVQVLSLLFVLFVFMFTGYRNRIVELVQVGSTSAYATERRIDADQTYYSDILIQNTTTITDVPQERGRYGIVEYEVKSGDTIFKIAQFFDVSEKTVRDTNNLSAAHLIKPGQILRIPPADGIVIKVAKGETLESVSKKYKGTGQTEEEVMQAIADVNWLDAPFALKEGEELFVPGGELPKPPRSRRTTYAGASRSPSSYSQPADSSVGRFLGWPVAGGAGRVTQCYKSYHNGVDIADGSMPDLVAAASGTVVFAGCHSGRCPPPGQMSGGSGAGWGVEVDHGNGYTTVYAHMFQIYVKAGDKVQKGQALGQMGRTGTATGIHVHFMLWRGGRYKTINPAPYMERRICGS